MQEQVQVGFMVFVADGQLGVGAVRQVRPESGELIVNIENRGDFTLPAAAVRDVHSGKVVLDVERLPEAMRQALHHPHDTECPLYAAEDPTDGALEDSRRGTR